jgi:uncharacterized protein
MGSDNRTEQGRFRPGTTGNPKGRPRKRREDGWSNVLTGVGTGRDKRTAARFGVDFVSEAEARDLWRGDDITARVIECLPEDALRGGFEVKADDKDTSEEIDAALEEMGATDAILAADQYDRAYGGAAILPVVNDAAGSLATPLRPESMSRIERLLVFEPSMMQPLTWDGGTPETWRLSPVVEGTDQPASEIVHASRLIVLRGIRVTQQPVAGVRPGFGDSVLTRMRQALREFVTGYDSIGALLINSTQDIYQMSGLDQLMAHDHDDIVKNRLALIDTMRSFLRMVVIDKEDTFERKQLSFAGLGDLLDRLGQRLAAATGMPLTKLLGVSPAGLNATGESDAANWRDAVAAHQTHRLHRIVEDLVRRVLLTRDGPTGGREPRAWSIEWCPLYQPSDKEREDARLVRAQSDKIYIELGVLTPEMVARARFGGDTYSYETQIDLAEIERLEQVNAEREAAALAANQAALAAVAAGKDAPDTDEPEDDVEAE